MLSLQRNWYWFSRAAAAPVVAFRRVGADHRLVGVDRRLGAPEQALAVEVRAGVAEVALAKVGMGPEWWWSGRNQWSPDPQQRENLIPATTVLRRSASAVKFCVIRIFVQPEPSAEPVDSAVSSKCLGGPAGSL